MENIDLTDVVLIMLCLYPFRTPQLGVYVDMDAYDI